MGSRDTMCTTPVDCLTPDRFDGFLVLNVSDWSCRVNGSEQTSTKRLSMVFANDRICNGIWILAGYVVLVL